MIGDFFSDLIKEAQTPQAAQMLKFFAVVLILNGRWLIRRLEAHLEGFSLARSK